MVDPLLSLAAAHRAAVVHPPAGVSRAPVFGAPNATCPSARPPRPAFPYRL
jgi:hypothetical protein